MSEYRIPATRFAFPAAVGLNTGLLLRDGSDNLSAAERHFYDVYHLFLNKFARLTYNVSLSTGEEVLLRNLWDEVIAAKRRLEAAEPDAR